MSAETYHETMAKMDKTGSDNDAYTYYGTLQTPKSETITVNGEEVSRIELGRRLVGVLAKNIEINGRTFKTDEIGKFLVDALDEAANPKLAAYKYEHVVEMAKMCGADFHLYGCDDGGNVVIHNFDENVGDDCCYIVVSVTDLLL